MPRLGLGMPISSTASSAPVTVIDDFFFESDTSGEVTPIYTASRKQFARNNNDVGINAGVTKDTSIAVPPGQTGTAIRVAETATTGQHFAQTFIDDVTAGDTYTMSLYVKSTYSSIIIYTNTSQISSNVTVNFTNETIATSGLRAGIEDAGGGWYRVNWTQVAQASGVSSIYLVVKDLTSYAGNTSNFTDYFGMQVEQDSRASSFMLNTTSNVLTVSTTLNDTSEVWDFDSTDIMLEADPEDEGFWEEGSNLVLNHDYEELGSEKVASGTFSSFSVASGDVTISGDTASFVDGGTNTNSRVSLDSDDIVANKIHKVVLTVTRYVAGRVQVIFGGGAAVDVDISAGVGTYTVYVLAGGSTTAQVKRDGNHPNFDFDLTNISIKQVDPNDRWTLGTGWSIEDGKLKGDGTNTDFQSAQQNNVTTVGDTYEVTVTVEAVSGVIELKGNGVYTRIDTLGVGTHTFNIVADSTYIRFLAHASATTTLDNFTVREYAVQPKDI